MILRNVDLFPFNTFGLHARAACFSEIADLDDLHAVLSQPELDDLPRFILGGGSNIVLENDFPGIVFKVAIAGKTLIEQTTDARIVEAGAGESWHDFVDWTLAQGWGGLENLSLIPGTVGAAPVQNIGAYGLEVSELLDSLEAIHLETREVKRFTVNECRLGYRESFFRQHPGQWLILRVRFRLPLAWTPRTGYPELARELARQAIASPDPRQISDAVVRIRGRKLPDPKKIGNVGSFFKNPIVSRERFADLHKRWPHMPHHPQHDTVKIPAGWLIEQTGWKGRALGPAACHRDQALVLVNLQGATGKEIRRLAEQIREDVEKTFLIALEYEAVFV